MTAIVILTLDHWHADLPGFCGGDAGLTPRLDALAACSVVFDRHFATETAVTASASRVSAGRAWAGDAWGTSPESPVAATRLLKAGVAVEVVSDLPAPWLTLAGWDREHGAGTVELAGERLVDRFVERVEALADKPDRRQLLWAALSAPSRVDGREWPSCRQAIDTAMREWDRLVGATVDAIDELGLADELLLVVSGGCGACLGNRGFENFEPPTLHEERLRTPLMLRGPGIVGGQRQLELVQTTDLLPTTLDWFGKDTKADPLPGISLLALARGEPGEWRDAIVVRDAETWGLRTGELFLSRPATAIEGQITAADDPETRLYSKPDDAWDLVDVAEQGRLEVQELEIRLDAAIGWIAAGHQGPPPALSAGWSAEPDETVGR